MKKILMALLAIFVFSGCKSNPYPDGKYSAQKQEKPPATVINYFIEAPNKVNFSEGIQGKFTIHGMVPAPGVAQIALEGLPQGAVYSDVDQSVTWTPDYNAGNDPKNPNSGSMDYNLVVTLTSSVDSKTVFDKTITLTVYDTPRSYKVLGFNDFAYINEGDTFKTSFAIEDLESPQGPFTIGQSNAPDGITFTPDSSNPRNYAVTFYAGYGLVDSTYTKTHTDTKDFNWTLLVTDARGKTLSVPVTWHITDMRKDPLYVGPTQFSVKSKELDFIFQAQDPNLEIEPTVTITSTNSGRVDLTTLPPAARVKGQMPTQSFHVHWSNIPQASTGHSEDLKINMCVYDRSQHLYQCAIQTVTVNFTSLTSDGGRQ